jgi:GNAT superfamily N-acetyltransferase
MCREWTVARAQPPAFPVWPDPMSDWDIQVQFGLPEACREDAAKILCAAFWRKLSPLMGARHIVPVLQHDMEPQMILAASVDGRLVGIAGVQWGDQHFVRFARATFVRELGVVRGSLKHLASRWAYSKEAASGELLLEALAVHPAMRGRGVGTRLILAAEDLALARGLTDVRLDVVDTNPRARRLYERLGFRPVEVHHYQLLRPIVGFGAYTTMAKALD